MAHTFICALCSATITKNVYFCAQHKWHICYDCLRKGTFTTSQKCPKCGTEVTRVD